MLLSRQPAGRASGWPLSRPPPSAALRHGRPVPFCGFSLCELMDKRQKSSMQSVTLCQGLSRCIIFLCRMVQTSNPRGFTSWPRSNRHRTHHSFLDGWGNRSHSPHVRPPFPDDLSLFCCFPVSERCSRPLTAMGVLSQVSRGHAFHSSHLQACRFRAPS